MTLSIPESNYISLRAVNRPIGGLAVAVCQLLYGQSRC
jgi:hypothetical protein